MQWAPISARVLDALPGVRMISRLGIGYDMVDLEAATERGVAVANTPDYCIEEVACHTLALVLDRPGGWSRSTAPCAAGGGRRRRPTPMPPARRRRRSPSSGTAASARGSLRRSRRVGFQVLVHDRYVADRTGSATTA